MAAFREVYNQYGRQVYRFLLHLSGDPALAEELMQETFYQAFLHMDQFEGRGSLLTWLCRIGKNAWLRECRRDARRGQAPPEFEDSGPGPEERAIDRDDARRIRAALEALPEPYKEVFILHVFAEQPLNRIAQIYGKSESWARVTFYRAKGRILQEVEK